MVLQKRTISFNFAQGLDTKTDEKLVNANFLTELENSVFTKSRSLVKRNGSICLNNKDLDGNEITNGRALGALGNELILFSNSGFYSYLESSNSWIKKGEIPSIDITSNSIVKLSTASQANAEIATLNGVSVYAWIDSRGGVRASITDEFENAVIVNDELLAATALSVKCLAVGTVIAVIYIAGTTLYGRIVNPFNPSFGSEIAIQSDVNASNKFMDFTTTGSYITGCYVETSGDIKVLTITQNMIAGSGLIGLPSPVIINPSTPDGTLAIYSLDDTYFFILWGQTGSGLYAHALNLDLTIAMPTIQVVATANVIDKITSAKISSTEINIFYNFKNVDVSNYLVQSVTLDINTTVGTPSDLIRSLGISSKAFIIDDITYIPCVHESTLQATYFLVRSDGVVIAKFFYQLAGGQASGNTLPESSFLDSETVLLAHLTAGRLASESGDLFTLKGITKTKVEFATTETSLDQNVELGGKLHIAGGLPKIYDGTSVVESGFHVYPEDITTTSFPIGGSQTDGTRQYIAIYEWTDAKGDIHRSATSIAVSVTLSAGTSTERVEVTIPTLRVTEKENVNIVLYRTINLGSIFYRVFPLTITYANNKAFDSVTLNDTYSDTSIQTNEILYTTGGVLDNIAPSATDIVTSYVNRIFYVSSTNELRYSKAYVNGQGLGYNDSFVIRVKDFGGPIKSLKAMDDKLIIEKETATFFIRGEGPLATGANNDFTEAQLIANDTGSINSKCVALTPLGVIYKSNKGIYLLDRALTPKYIGAPVEAYNDETVFRTTLVPDVNEIRMITSNKVIVYNYFEGKWSIFTGFDDAIDSVMVNNIYHWVDINGIVCKEMPDYFKHKTNQSYSQKIVTGWFAFAKKQGFQRIYSFMLLGKFKADHILKVKVYYDYKSYSQDEFRVSVSDILNNTYYGSDPYYGGGSTYGGEGDRVYQFKFRPVIQKCESIKLEITDIFESQGTEGFELSDIIFEVGIKGGSHRVSHIKEIRSA
jgi:hypothetical protein